MSVNTNRSNQPHDVHSSDGRGTNVPRSARSTRRRNRHRSPIRTRSGAGRQAPSRSSLTGDGNSENDREFEIDEETRRLRTMDVTLGAAISLPDSQSPPASDISGTGRRNVPFRGRDGSIDDPETANPLSLPATAGSAAGGTAQHGSNEGPAARRILASPYRTIVEDDLSSVEYHHSNRPGRRPLHEENIPGVGTGVRRTIGNHNGQLGEYARVATTLSRTQAYLNDNLVDRQGQERAEEARILQEAQRAGQAEARGGSEPIHHDPTDPQRFPGSAGHRVYSNGRTIPNDGQVLQERQGYPEAVSKEELNARLLGFGKTVSEEIQKAQVEYKSMLDTFSKQISAQLQSFAKNYAEDLSRVNARLNAQHQVITRSPNSTASAAALNPVTADSVTDPAMIPVKRSIPTEVNFEPSFQESLIRNGVFTSTPTDGINGATQPVNRSGSVPIARLAADPGLKPYYPKNDELPKYDGKMKTNHREWFSKVETLISHSKVPEGAIIARLPNMLEGAALKLYENRQRVALDWTWEDWKQTFASNHETDKWRSWLRGEKEKYRFREAENDPRVWFYEYIDKSRWLNPSLSDRDIIADMLNAMPGSIATQLAMVPHNYDLIAFEKWFLKVTEYMSSSGFTTHSSNNHKSSSENKGHSSRSNPTNYKPSGSNNYNRNKPYQANNKPRPYSTNSAPKPAGINAVSASKPNVKPPYGNSYNKGTGAHSDFSCHGCGKKGVYRRNCPHCNPGINHMDEEDNTTEVESDAESNHDEISSDEQISDIEGEEQHYTIEALTGDLDDFQYDYTLNWADEMDRLDDLELDSNIHSLEADYAEEVQAEDQEISALAKTTKKGLTNARPLVRHSREPVYVSPQEAAQFLASEKHIELSQVIDPQFNYLNVHKYGISPRLLGIINKKPVMVLVDSGAALSAVSKGFIENSDPKFREKLVPHYITAVHAFGHSMKVLGLYPTTLILPHPRGNLNMKVAFLVVDTTNQAPVIIGSDIITLYGIDLHSSKKRYITLAGSSSRFAVQHMKVHSAIAKPPIQPTTSAELYAINSKRVPSSDDEVSMALIKRPRTGPSDDASTAAQSSATHDDPDAKPPPALSARAEATNKSFNEVIKQDPEFWEAVEKAAFSPELSIEQTQELKIMLFEHREAFAYGKRQLGDCKLPPMKIEVDIPHPCPPRLKSAPYPASPKTKKDIEDIIENLLELGVIRRSQSQYASPVVMVYREGKARLCVNYKALNDYTKPFRYPLPKIDETLAKLRGAKYITTLDMNKGFHQCWVDPESVPLTAFVTHAGLYEYVRMPFGLRNAPAHFQMNMNELLGTELREGWFNIYIDDGIPASETWEEHVNEHLPRVLKKAISGGFTFSLAKSQFAFPTLKALGKKVSGLALAIDPHKLVAVEKWERPKTLRQLQAFLGFINYHRNHIPSLAKIVRPLSYLLSKDVAWEWTSDREKAFQDAKTALISATELVLPNFTQPFRLYIDACFEGLGAELTQVQDGVEKPVIFISRKLKLTEERYGATQLECLGLIWALEKLYYYLDGSTFTVYTDCQAIKALMEIKNPNRHMLRWQLAVQEHRGEMTVVHKPGVLNKAADGLSRSAIPNDENNPAADLDPAIDQIYYVSCESQELELDYAEICTLTTIGLVGSIHDSIRKGYEKSVSLTAMIDGLKANDDKTLRAAKASLAEGYHKELDNGNFFVMDDMLYRKKGLSSAVVISDTDNQLLMMKACHDAPIAGHFGYEKTLEKLRLYAWWPGMATDTKLYVKTCNVCAAAKRGTNATLGQLIQIETPKQPWQIIHMDFVTALPPAGALKYDSALIIVDRATKKAKFLPTHKNVSAKEVAAIYWERVFPEYGLPSVIISDRDPKFTSEYWKHLWKLCGTRLAMSSAHHPQTDGLAERTIQTFVDMIRRYCAYGLVYTNDNEIDLDWVNLLPSLEFAYNTSKHKVTGLSPFEVERGWTPKGPTDMIVGNVELQIPATSDGAVMAAAVKDMRKHAAECVKEAFKYAKERWDKKHQPPKINIGDQVMLSTKHFNVLGSRKLKDPWVGPFVVKEAIGTNAFRLALPPKLGKKHDVFPVSLLKIREKAKPGTLADRKQDERKAPEMLDEYDEPEWEVDAVLGVRNKKRNGKVIRQYLLKYTGYEKPSWENESNCDGCRELIVEFEKKRGNKRGRAATPVDNSGESEHNSETDESASDSASDDEDYNPDP